MNNRKNINLREPILRLHAEGKKIREIKAELNCSYSTISYHLYPKTKESTRKRYEKSVVEGRRPIYGKNYNTKPRNVLQQKYGQFFRLGARKNKLTLERTFTLDELIEYIGDNPTCYLTGEKINLATPSEYSLDHKIPSSKNGECSLENLGLCKSDINRMKNDKTPEELIEICKKILTHNGFTITKNDGGGVVISNESIVI